MQRRGETNNPDELCRWLYLAYRMGITAAEGEPSHAVIERWYRGGVFSLFYDSEGHYMACEWKASPVTIDDLSPEISTMMYRHIWFDDVESYRDIVNCSYYLSKFICTL